MNSNGTAMSHFGTTVKVVVFLLASAAFLIFGGLFAHLLWFRMHHRYDQPSAGVYYGSVYANLEIQSADGLPSLRFEGRSRQRWHLLHPGNFRYSELSLEWRHWRQAGLWPGSRQEGRAVLSLPGFTYTTTNTTGLLTREVLAGWLFGTTNLNLIGTNAIPLGAIYDYLKAAGDGNLPPPRHHRYHFGISGGDVPEGSLRVTLQHFRLGLGVGDYVWVWIPIWMCFTWVLWKRWFRRGGADTKPVQ
jgi:hypothetical protein